MQGPTLLIGTLKEQSGEFPECYRCDLVLVKWGCGRHPGEERSKLGAEGQGGPTECKEMSSDRGVDGLSWGGIDIANRLDES